MGEFEKRIDNIPETSMIEDAYEITAKVKMIVEEAKKEFPLHLCIEGDESIQENLSRYKQKAIEWFERWFDI